MKKLDQTNIGDLCIIHTQQFVNMLAVVISLPYKVRRANLVEIAKQTVVDVVINNKITKIPTQHLTLVSKLNSSAL